MNAPIVCGTAQFNLTDEDWQAIGVAQNAARLILKRTADREQAEALHEALRVLERMPETTPGARITYSVNYRCNEELRSISFYVDEQSLAISLCATIYDSHIGSDPPQIEGWRFALDGNRDTSLELGDVEDGLQELLNLGGEITAIDDSEAKWGQEPEEMEPQSKHRSIVAILRWIAVLPTAVLSSFTAYVIARFVSRIGVNQFYEPRSLMGRIVVDAVASAAFGAGFIWVAIAVAPAYKRKMCFVSVGLLIFLSGFLVFGAVLSRAMMSILANVFMLIGAIAMAYKIYLQEKGESQ